MKKNTYDGLSLLAVVGFIVFTVLAQHSDRSAYIFGTLAIFTAGGLLALYVKALQKPGSRNDLEAQDYRQLPQATYPDLGSVDALMHRRLTLVERMRVARLHDEIYGQYARSRQFWYRSGAIEHLFEVKVGDYIKQVKFHRDPNFDPAAIVADIVERLCAGSKEPRFEFVLGLDGSFKIQQISAGRAGNELSESRVEPVPEEKSDPQAVN